jgi:hypothetical protein
MTTELSTAVESFLANDILSRHRHIADDSDEVHLRQVFRQQPAARRWPLTAPVFTRG